GGLDRRGVGDAAQGLARHVWEGTRLALLREARTRTERGARWRLHSRRPPFDIRETIVYFAGGAATLRSSVSRLLVGADLAAFEQRRDGFAERGVPDELAEQCAAFVPMFSTFDLVGIAHQTGRPVEEVAEVYF